MARNLEAERIYRHFCMGARALEVVGERWSLLIVRDLLPGPRRFTDLIRSLNPITPTRLTDRLRRLEAAGVVEREPAGSGREVWYRLTDAGRDLGPAIDELTFWGIVHSREAPRADEPVHGEAAMIGTKVWLNRFSSAPPDGLIWVWRFRGQDSYSLLADDGAWELTRGEQEGAAVTVEATSGDWAVFLTTPRERRRLPSKGVRLEGSKSDVNRFVKAFGAKPAGR
ncbi:MAG TPA: helix-turn-helix domain-containing protein [Solirubrobacterales bacterium]|nr:helix-turn-helix domain-containing protein [Solirubrobacterales bacterium]